MISALNKNLNYPKISIVTPSFNQGRYIEQTILSVLDQHYPNLEYIIIDGGSTDQTIDIIKKYESHISYWISEPDGGQTDAINKGFAKSSGDIFNWINSDDYYQPGTFQVLADSFDDSSVNVVCGREWGFNDEDPNEKILHPGSILADNVFETIRVGIIDQPCTFFRRKKIEGFFPLCTKLRYVMDRQLWYCYLLKYGHAGIVKLKDIFTQFRLHSGSKSMAEAQLFENEFAQLRSSLLHQLKAPEILIAQLDGGKDNLDLTWDIAIEPKENILASFASYFAQRSYINDDLDKTSKLMKLVNKYKGWNMNSMEMKLWVYSRVLPLWLLLRLKKIKQAV